MIRWWHRSSAVAVATEILSLILPTGSRVSPGMPPCRVTDILERTALGIHAPTVENHHTDTETTEETRTFCTVLQVPVYKKRSFYSARRKLNYKVIGHVEIPCSDAGLFRSCIWPSLGSREEQGGLAVGRILSLASAAESRLHFLTIICYLGKPWFCNRKLKIVRWRFQTQNKISEYNSTQTLTEGSWYSGRTKAWPT